MGLFLFCTFLFIALAIFACSACHSSGTLFFILTHTHTHTHCDKHTHTGTHTECMHTSRTIRNAGTISIYLLFCNRENIWGTKYEVNSGGTFDQLFIWIFLWNFHRSCLFNSAKPWCKKVKNDQKLKSRGPALTFEQRMPWSWNWHISFPLSFFFSTPCY